MLIAPVILGLAPCARNQRLFSVADRFCLALFGCVARQASIVCSTLT